MASLGYSGMEPQRVVDSLAALGYGGVEWTLAHADPESKTPEQLAELIEITLQGGLVASEICVQQDLVCLDDGERRRRIEFVKECLRALSAAGADTFNLFTGPAPWVPTAPRVGRDIGEGRAWAQVLEAFDEFVAEAERLQVHLAVEGVWGHLCHDYYTTRLLIDHYNSPWLGVNFDPSHDVLAGRLDVGWIAKQWGDRIKHMHLKDAVGIQEEGKFVFPLLGEGNVDWKGLFTALDEIDYQGFLSVEFESFTYLRQVLGDDIEEAARLSMEQIKRLVQL
ncbi:MAG: sugar phosphate isomerase/epimerase [Armatimonadetes bacterium]|nr:sugar phosphate isomerase/epimerase [Armatimonadota bacterium]